jgi:phage tail P2-like protein
VDLLPYLAWALSVDRWDKDWPAERKIAAIQKSYWLHRRKGTRAAVRRVVEDMGFQRRLPSGLRSVTSREPSGLKWT